MVCRFGIIIREKGGLVNSKAKNGVLPKENAGCLDIQVMYRLENLRFKL